MQAKFSISEPKPPHPPIYDSFETWYEEEGPEYYAWGFRSESAYRNFCCWCREVGAHPCSRSAFFSRLAKRGYVLALDEDGEMRVVRNRKI